MLTDQWGVPTFSVPMAIPRPRRRVRNIHLSISPPWLTLLQQTYVFTYISFQSSVHSGHMNAGVGKCLIAFLMMGLRKELPGMAVTKTLRALYYRIFSNLIRTNFCRFLKRKKELVRGFNPHLSFNRPMPTRQTDSVISDDGESDDNKL